MAAILALTNTAQVRFLALSEKSNRSWSAVMVLVEGKVCSLSAWDNLSERQFRNQPFSGRGIGRDFWGRGVKVARQRLRLKYGTAVMQGSISLPSPWRKKMTKAEWEKVHSI